MRNLLSTAILAAMIELMTASSLGAGSTPRRIDIAVTEDGFSPKKMTVKKEEPVTLVFTRRTDRTCAKNVVIYMDDDKTVARDLPLNQKVEVTVTFTRAGEHGFACSMRMHGAAIMVE